MSKDDKTSPVQTREDGIQEALQIVRSRLGWIQGGKDCADAIEALLSQPEPKGDKAGELGSDWNGDRDPREGVED
jgi:hypothetical protein